MTKVEKLEREVEKLNSSELVAFRKWFLEYDAECWDREIEQDIQSGQLDKIAGKSLEDHKAGRTGEI